MSSFHRCMRKNKDDSNRIIEKDKWCSWPTTSPFWKKAEDLSFKIRTRSQEQKQELVKRSDFNRYCRRIGQEDQKMARSRRLRTVLYEGIRSLFCPSLAMLSYILIFIVNNGNILTDGRRYRKKPELKCKIYINLNKVQRFHRKNSVFY